MLRPAFLLCLLALVACPDPPPEPDPPTPAPTPQPTPEPTPPPPVRTELKIASGTVIVELLTGLGLTPQDAAGFVEAAKPIHDLARIRAGESVFIERARDGTIMLFEYPLDRFREHRLVVTRDASAWVARLDARAVDRVPVALSNTVRGSLWAAADGVGLSADNIVALASIFEWEIDFNTQVQNGDRFRLIVLEVRDRATGEALRYADILAAEYQNGATPHRAVRYEDRAGDVGFFDDEGMSTRKMFLKSPLKFSRISSGFSKSRFHPVKQEWRAHKGTDFAAASGTPVRAIGAGRVEFAGTKGGYGKHVRVKHQGKYGSSYSHLSRIAVRSGQGVSQGDLVGYVGATGLATGPHLHFEFYVNGGQVDFMRQTFPRTEPIDDAERPRFLVIAGQMFPQLDSITFREAEAGDDDSADSDSAPP